MHVALAAGWWMTVEPWSSSPVLGSGKEIHQYSQDVFYAWYNMLAELQGAISRDCHRYDGAAA